MDSDDDGLCIDPPSTDTTHHIDTNTTAASHSLRDLQDADLSSRATSRVFSSHATATHVTGEDTHGKGAAESESPSLKLEQRLTRHVGREWSGVTFEEARERLSSFAHERDWNQYHSPRNLVLALVGEVGELAELFQWRTEGEAAPGLPGFAADKRQMVREELADVAAYLIRLADRCGIDLGEALFEKIAKNEKKYPAARVKGSNKKYTDYREYWAEIEQYHMMRDTRGGPAGPASPESAMDSAAAPSPSARSPMPFPHLRARHPHADKGGGGAMTPSLSPKCGGGGDSDRRENGPLCDDKGNAERVGMQLPELKIKESLMCALFIVACVLPVLILAVTLATIHRQGSG
uniref:dCTP pyrophosphatase 1 n=1 Tax=Vitrella brassicaformis TaxID=1169539 RepID=A0A7S1JXE1_9ALVE|mmetsp:Transcript_29431/g.73276  ORF Transcript_29431/g.73276 Transcript_29431/m.73276 type:complete len:349 (+) Transcript_29431:41-1087(+)